MIPPGYEVIEGVDMSKFVPRDGHICLRWLKKTVTKGGIAIPQTRWRAGFMKAQILAVAHGENPLLTPGTLVEFNGLGEKGWLGAQDPEDRDTVFVTRVENIYAVVDYVNARPVLTMMGEWVLMRPDKESELSEGGILKPAPARELAQRQKAALWGEVLGAGDLVKSCRKGDRIAFDATTAVPLRLGDHNDELALVIDGDLDVLMMEEKAAVAA